MELLVRDAFERKRITFELSVHVYVFDFHLLIKLFLIEKKKRFTVENSMSVMLVIAFLLPVQVRRQRRIADSNF